MRPARKVHAETREYAINEAYEELIESEIDKASIAGKFELRIKNVNDEKMTGGPEYSKEPVVKSKIVEYIRNYKYRFTECGYEVIEKPFSAWIAISWGIITDETQV